VVVLRSSVVVAEFNPILILTLHDSPFLIDFILGVYATKAVKNVMAKVVEVEAMLLLHLFQLFPPYCVYHARVHCNTDILTPRSQFSL